MALSIYEVQNASNIHLLDRIKYGGVIFFRAIGIR